MVQQNLVEYILSQMRKGRRLEEINQFLINAGYDKAEVESSIQYIINVQSSPQLAEQQRIQQLAQYITKQMSAGYDQQTIANFLISRGYPYYEVNSALQQATLPKREEREIKVEHKLMIVAMVIMFLMTAAVTVMYFKAYTLIGIGVPEQLLDVETEKLTTIVQQGGELSFQVKLINFGYEKRFDVEMRYQVIDRESQAVVLEKTETLALSTTLENIVRFDIPETLRAGRYVLRTDATYKDYTATSGFIFDVLPKEVAEERLQEIREQLPEIEENISEIPELAPPVVEAEPGVEEIPEAPEEPAVPTPIPPAPRPTEPKFYEGKTKQQAFQMVKAVSVREPERAVSMCKELRIPQNRRECIKMIAQFKEDGTYCNFLEGRDKDLCLLDMVIELGQNELCAQMEDARIRSSCEMMGGITNLPDKPSSERDAMTDALAGFSLQVMPS